MSPCDSCPRMSQSPFQRSCRRRAPSTDPDTPAPARPSASQTDDFEPRFAPWEECRLHAPRSGGGTPTGCTRGSPNRMARRPAGSVWRTRPPWQSSPARLDGHPARPSKGAGPQWIRVNPVVVQSLIGAGYRCLGDLRWVPERQLIGLRYVGIKTARTLRQPCSGSKPNSRPRNPATASRPSPAQVALRCRAPSDTTQLR
jgi:hypothetical protein